MAVVHRESCKKVFKLKVSVHMHLFQQVVLSFVIGVADLTSTV